MSLYPLSIDTQLPIVNDLTPVSAKISNDLRSSILACQAELGLKPSGIYGTVRERLNALDAKITSLEIQSDGYGAAGSLRSVQFNDNGAFGGAQQVTISSDGYLEVGKAKVNGVPASGDIRLANIFNIYSKDRSGAKTVPIMSFRGAVGLPDGYQDNWLIIGSATTAGSFSSTDALGVYAERIIGLVAGPSNNAGMYIYNGDSRGNGIQLYGNHLFPNTSFGVTNNTVTLTASGDPFKEAKGVVLVGDINTLPTGNPTSGFFLWSDPTTHHPIVKLPSGLSFDLISVIGGPTGDVNSVQFNNSGALGGANQTTISSDGYLVIGNKRAGGASTVGDLRLSRFSSIWTKSRDGARNIPLFKQSESGVYFTDDLTIGYDGTSSLAFGSSGNALDSVTINSVRSNKIGVGNVSGRYSASVFTMGSSNFYSGGANSLRLVNIAPNLVIGQESLYDAGLNYDPMGGGLGLGLMRGLNAPPTGAPTGGYWWWSDPTTFHPMVMLPDGYSYDLLAGGAGGGTIPSSPLNSVQFNSGGLSFGGAAQVTISNDGYLEIGKYKSNAIASGGDIRLSNKFNINSLDGYSSKDLTIFRSYGNTSSANADTIYAFWNGVLDTSIWQRADMRASKFIGITIGTGAVSGFNAYGPGAFSAAPDARFAFAHPNFALGPISTINGLSADPFGDGYGYIYLANLNKAATGNPSGGNWLWVDGADGYVKYKQPSGNTIILSGATGGANSTPGGLTGSVQYNQDGYLGGASNIFISSDGYLEVGKAKPGGTALSGDVRLSRNYVIRHRNGSNTQDMNVLKYITNQDTVLSGNLRDLLTVGGDNVTASNIIDDIEITAGKYTSINAIGVPFFGGGGTAAGVAAFANDIFSNQTTNGGVAIWNNLAIGGRQSLVNITSSSTNQPFRDGYGIVLVKDVVSIPTIAPTNGFDLWSDATTHEPTVQLPNGFAKSLLPQGDGYSVQYKNGITGGLAGAGFASISTDGYLQLANSRSGGSASIGDLRLARSFTSYFRSNDGTKDIPLIYTGGVYNNISIGARDFINQEKSDFTTIYGNRFSSLSSGFDSNTSQFASSVAALGPNPLIASGAPVHFVAVSRNLMLSGNPNDFNSYSSNPFGDGYGYFFLKDRNLAATGNPSDGFWMWSDSTNHHPIVQLPNGSIYDLITVASSSVSGSNGSVQYNKDGYFAGAAHLSINDSGYAAIDGYELFSHTSSTPAASLGNVALYADSADGYLKYRMASGNIVTLRNQNSQAVTTISGTYSVSSSDNVIIVTTLASPFTITLPASPAIGDQYTIKDGVGTSETNSLTISGNGKNIDGSSTYIISANYAAATFIYNGTQYNVI